MAERSVLFVDDEQNILSGLKRMLHRYKKNWNMFFAVGGHEALEVIKRENINVLVTDMKMPDMNGIALMRQVKRKYPSIARIVLSGHSERQDVIQSASLAHQYLAKPCKSDKLIEVINNTYYVNHILKNDDVKRVISTIEALPSLPQTYFMLMEELESKDFSLRKVGTIISEDIGMSTSILKQVNSSFWGLANHISSPEQAVNMLGGDIVKALVLSSHIFQLLESNELVSIDEIEKKSLLTGRFSRVITSHLTVTKQQADNCFIASLLQDVGRLILINNFPSTYKVVLEEAEKHEGVPLRNVELSIMGVTHSEVGAYLLGLWGMPNDIVSAVALHHKPERVYAECDIVVAISYLANQLSNHLLNSNDCSMDSFDINKEYLQELELQKSIESIYSECKKVFQEVVYE